MVGRHNPSTLWPASGLAGDEGSSGLSDGQLLGRFVEGRDTAAFEALVRRHGPMVLGVCRRVLRDGNDADDAFQATFLVLLRKAASIAPREAVAGWLYGVAHRTALKARALAARRRLREKQPTAVPEPAAAPADSVNDFRPVLDRELSRLPERYRVPIVLCDLEGMPQKAAAQLLGCPEGTVSGRLTRARRMLAARLARHAPAVGLTAAGVADIGAAGPALTAALVSETVQTACTFLARPAVAGGPAFLAERVVRAMFLQRVRSFGLGLLGVAVLGSALGVWLIPARAVPAARQPLPAASVTLSGQDFDDVREVLRIVRRSGRVVPGPDRAPNARLLIEFYEGGEKLSQTLDGGGYDSTGVASAWGKPIDFCVQAVDLDYLPLAEGKKGHCRVQLKVGIEGGASGSTQNVPKDLFNFAEGGSGGGFSASAGSGDRVPLFWLKTGTNETYGVDSPEKVIAMNKKGKIAIAYLVIQPKAAAPK